MEASSKFETDEYFFTIRNNKIQQARVEKITITKLKGRGYYEIKYDCNIDEDTFRSEEKDMYKTKEDLIIELLLSNKIDIPILINELWTERFNGNNK